MKGISIASPQSHRELREAIAELLIKTSLEPEPSASDVDTTALIRELARNWSAPPEGSLQAALDQLSRKIAIDKRVDRGYLRDWQCDGAPRELTPRGYLALAAVLLAYANSESSGSHEQRGRALRFLNAALFARDHCAGEPQWISTLFDDITRQLITEHLGRA